MAEYKYNKLHRLEKVRREANLPHEGNLGNNVARAVLSWERQDRKGLGRKVVFVATLECGHFAFRSNVPTEAQRLAMWCSKCPPCSPPVEGALNPDVGDK